MRDREPNKRMWYGMSAAEARAEGFDVPEPVPDCAYLTFEYAGCKSTFSDDPKGQSIGVEFSMQPCWNWVSLKAEVSP